METNGRLKAENLVSKAKEKKWPPTFRGHAPLEKSFGIKAQIWQNQIKAQIWWLLALSNGAV